MLTYSRQPFVYTSYAVRSAITATAGLICRATRHTYTSLADAASNIIRPKLTYSRFRTGKINYWLVVFTSCCLFCKFV